MADENEDSGGIDTSAPEFQDAVKAAVAEATQGLKKTAADIKAEKKALADSLKAWDGLDPEQVRAMLAKAEENEDADLLKSGKFDDVITKKLAKAEKDHQSVLATFKKNLEDRDGQIGGLTEQISKLTIDGQIMQAAQTSKGFKPSALPDLLARARAVFKIDPETGERDARLPNGDLLTGKDGTTAADPAHWVNEIVRKEAPHFWEGSSGQDTPGAGATNGAGGKAMLRSEYDRMANDPLMQKELDQKFADGWTVRDD